MIPRVHIGFWPTRNRGVVLGAVRICDDCADVTVSNLYPLVPRQGVEIGLVPSQDTPVAVNPDAITVDSQTGQQGLSVVSSVDPSLTGAAVSQMADQANEMLAAMGAPFFPALCSAIGALINASDSSMPCAIASAVGDACSSYDQGDKTSFASKILQAVKGMAAAGVNASDAVKAILEAVTRCSFEMTSNSALMSDTLATLRQQIDPQIVDSLFARAGVQITGGGCPTAQDPLEGGAPVLPFVSSKLEQSVQILNASPSAVSVTAAFQPPMGASEAASIANALDSRVVGALLDVLRSAERAYSGQIGSIAPAPVLVPFGSALLERAMREMRSDYSAETLKDILCYAVSCLGGDDSALRTWGVRVPQATAAKIVDSGLFNELSCTGPTQYAVAMLFWAVSDAANRSGGLLGRFKRAWSYLIGGLR